jgi:hypothetical protein
MPPREKSPSPSPSSFEEAARRIAEEGETIPFDEVLRRLVKSPPSTKDNQKVTKKKRHPPPS